MLIGRVSELAIHLQWTLPLLKDGANLYGLYTNYESSHNDACDVVACSDGVEGQMFLHVKFMRVTI